MSCGLDGAQAGSPSAGSGVELASVLRARRHSAHAANGATPGVGGQECTHACVCECVRLMCLCACACVCMCVFVMCLRVRVHVCVCEHLCVRVRVCVNACMRACLRACNHLFVRTCMW